MRESEIERQHPLFIFILIILAFGILVSITCTHFMQWVLGVYIILLVVVLVHVILLKQYKRKKSIISGKDVS